MKALRTAARLALDTCISVMLALPGGVAVARRFIALLFRRVREVTHESAKMSFTVPSWLAEYRAVTFSTKEPETLEWISASLRRDSVLWDVGANVGTYSVYAARATGCEVFAFEPSVFNVELLARNVFLNGLQEKIRIIPLALSDRAGFSTFRMSSTEWGGALSSFDKPIDQHGEAFHRVFEYSIYGLPMDEAVRRMDIPQPDAIKMDVDGVEHFILAGGRKVLSKVQTVLVEINDAFAEQRQLTEQLLTEAGLTLHRKCGSSLPTQFNQWWVRL